MGVFDDKEIPQVVTPPVVSAIEAAPPVNDIWTEKLKTIVREDGTPKYTTVEDALEALNASQAHIANIEAENALLAEKAKEAQTLQETLNRLGNTMNQEKPPVVTPGNGGLSEEAAKELVKNVLKGEKETELAIRNIMTVESKLVSKFGSEDAAFKALSAKAKELGVTLAKLKQDSATSPNYVLELFKDVKSTVTQNTSTVNLSVPQPTDPSVKRPDKSILSGRGATDRNQTDLMKQIRENIHKKHGITV